MLGTYVRVFAFSACAAVVRSLDNGLAERPPMGYSTWNDMECEVDEGQVKAVTEKLAAEGFRNLGYEYINIDDCWMERNRDFDNKLVAASTFPSGMAAVGNFIHSKGFKFGLYTSRGFNTCVGLAGSQDFEPLDAAMFAEWGVDFLKNDGCFDTECFAGNDRATWVCDGPNRKSVLDKYAKMRNSLNETGRPILYEVCGWEPWYAPVGAELSNFFRVGADVQTWEDVYEASHLVNQLGHYSRRGGWVHPDMLIGSSPGARFRLTPMQSRAQYTLWSVFPAPLILGVDVLNMTTWDHQTYTNLEVIGVNQDPLVEPAKKILCNCGTYPTISIAADGFSKFSLLWPTGDAASGSWREVNITDGNPFREPYSKRDHECQQVWARTLRNGDLVLASVNFGTTFAEFVIPRHALPEVWQEAGLVRVRDLWARRDLPYLAKSQAIKLVLAPDGGHSMLRLSRNPPARGAAFPQSSVTSHQRQQYGDEVGRMPGNAGDIGESRSGVQAPRAGAIPGPPQAPRAFPGLLRQKAFRPGLLRQKALSGGAVRHRHALPGLRALFGEILRG